MKMKIKIDIEQPNIFEKQLLDAAGDIWLTMLKKVPLDVVREKREATYLAEQIEPQNRTFHRKIRTWWRVTEVWDILPQIRESRLEDAKGGVK